MTPQAQRIAIAEACGWSLVHPHLLYSENPGKRIDEHPFVCPKGIPRWEWEVPKYTSDLNAMHEAEKTLTPKQRDDYADLIADGDLVHGENTSLSQSIGFTGALFAPAALRAEAFLRTIGKWKHE